MHWQQHYITEIKNWESERKESALIEKDILTFSLSLNFSKGRQAGREARLVREHFLTIDAAASAGSAAWLMAAVVQTHTLTNLHTE